VKKQCDLALTEREQEVSLHRFSTILKDNTSWDLHTDLLNYAALANLVFVHAMQHAVAVRFSQHAVLKAATV
jgi:hypothetical protein